MTETTEFNGIKAKYGWNPDKGMYEGEFTNTPEKVRVTGSSVANWFDAFSEAVFKYREGKR